MEMTVTGATGVVIATPGTIEEMTKGEAETIVTVAMIAVAVTAKNAPAVNSVPVTQPSVSSSKAFLLVHLGKISKTSLKRPSGLFTPMLKKMERKMLLV